MDNAMDKKNRQLERMRSYQLLVHFITKRKQNTDKAK